MARPVVAGDAGPVEHERDGQSMEADVEIGLVERPAEEGRVDGDDRAQPAHRHAGRSCHLVLLGDAHVEEPVGMPGFEWEQAGGSGHGRGQRHHVGVSVGRVEQGPGEGVGVGGEDDALRVGRPVGADDLAARVGRQRTAHGSAHRRADHVVGGVRPTGLHVVETLDVVFLGGGVPPALLGQDVDDDGSVPRRGVGEGLLHLPDVVAVDRPGVAHPERLEERVGRDHLAQRAGDAVEAGVRQVA